MNPSDFTIQVTVTINGQQATTAHISAPATTAQQQPQALTTTFENSQPLTYYEGYKGYNENFLGVPVRLPVLTPEQLHDAAKNNSAPTGTDPSVLPYTHFSVVMARSRQLALYTVVNIDGSQSQELTRGGSDKWYYDSRIAESEQIGEFLYKKNELDRGHLVRRLDPVWGPNAAQANDDTFHFTNCSPQHEDFNQGKDLWQGLENFILDNAEARDRKITVFTGPVLGEKDPIYKGVRLPLAFWKIIIYQKADGTLVTAGYLLEQGGMIKSMPGLEVLFEPGAFRVKINYLIERTGIDFSYLTDKELPLSSNGMEASQERMAVQENYANVVL
ncbi:DNA/RNA non-specific endonuclease [Hymenobacter tenuis]